MGGVTREKIISEFHLLEEKARLLNLEPLEVYLIGGGNLALRGLKSATKDVDVVMLSRKQFSLLQGLLETPLPKLPVYVRQYRSRWDYDLGMSSRYVHPLHGFSLDVFVKRVLNKLYLSEGMVSRAEVPGEFSSHELFRIHLVSKEDIFLFKSVTSMERVRDLEDLIALVETGLDYEIIIHELENQLSKDESLRSLVPRIIHSVDLLMQQIGAVKGLIHLRGYLKEISG
ncbi:hypothetical protein APY94_01900 [Thermococcus celericrescens]|uniref:Nucleotidyltransferase n=1 Tax=Thermococcus celericrescens TaxID=227598 RepID=A0A117ITZ1_9EURY|nr:hypothetical protein [Thermococcus celericrescens]KUH34410.1 hypothetical protein APY94_01900 [Thermococcus celericrescens]